MYSIQLTSSGSSPSSGLASTETVAPSVAAKAPAPAARSTALRSILRSVRRSSGFRKCTASPARGFAPTPALRLK